MIRLYRLLPVFGVMALIVAIAYLIMSFRYTSEKAKATLITFLIWLFGLGGIVSALITLYALFENNVPVTELFGSCFILMAVGFIITLICRAVFYKNHPHYGEEVAEAKVVNKSLSTRFAEAFRKALSQALKDTFKR